MDGSGSGSAGGDVEALERELMDAVQARDLDRLEVLVGASFTLTTGRPGAEVRSRDEWFAITAGEYVIESYGFEELVVDHHGSCAVARSRYSQRARMGSERRDSTYRMTDVWVATPAGWRLEARHAQPIAGD